MIIQSLLRICSLQHLTLLRNIRIDSIPEFLLSDTIGFINNLHHTLIDAFKSTLSEVRDSDLLLHIIDSSNPDYLKHKAITENLKGNWCSRYSNN